MPSVTVHRRFLDMSSPWTQCSLHRHSTSSTIMRLSQDQYVTTTMKNEGRQRQQQERRQRPHMQRRHREGNNQPRRMIMTSDTEPTTTKTTTKQRHSQDNNPPRWKRWQKWYCDDNDDELVAEIQTAWPRCWRQSGKVCKVWSKTMLWI